MIFLKDVLKMAEDMDEKEREVFLAMAEEIDKFEDELEQQKLIILSDFRKKGLGNKNYPDLNDFLLRNARIKMNRLYPSM